MATRKKGKPMQEIPVVIIGHKDHGKSTLIGRLILDTGSVKESRVKEVKEVDESDGRAFELAHLVDSFHQEREREMTMDTTRAVLKGKERNYQLIDVPGHAELISNMLTGASGAQAALLTVSLKEGVEEQTRQHLEVARLLGIEQLGVAINKIDAVGYRQEAYNDFKDRVAKILDEIGYSSEKIKFFPVSAKLGDNVVKLSEKTAWYQGQTLMEFLEREIKTPEPLDESRLIFLSQDCYDNLTVGRVESGSLKAGQELLILPEKRKAIVKSIQDYGRELFSAKAGDNAGILFSDGQVVERGGVATLPDSPLKVGRNFAGEIFWIEKPQQKNMVLECGTAQVSGELLEESPYKFLAEREIVFEPQGQTILSKVVFKQNGKIIGVGNINRRD